MRSITSSKSQSRDRTLTFGLKNECLFINNISITSIPFFCPICNLAISNNIDVESYNRVKCCRDCESDFAELNLEKWKEGHRPDEIDVLKKVKEREEMLFKRYVNTEK
jgi:hypothetical protein